MSASSLEPQDAISIHHTYEINPPPRTRYLRLDFRGSSSEYFRIWIVNVFLTVITLGIYGAWAKVRTRKYFYANTLLDGHPFEYHGNPMAILKGNLVIGAFALAYYAVNAFGGGDPFEHILFVYGVLGVFYLVYPFLVHSSLRFMAANSSYRNLRFKFHGTLGGSYGVHLGFMMLVPFSGGLLWPFVQYKQKHYMLDNAAYGTARARFTGEVGPYYTTYIVAALWGILGVIVIGMLSGLIVAGQNSAGGIGNDPVRMFMLIVPAYVMGILGVSLLQAYITARLTNYTWKHIGIPGKVRFESTVSARELIWLRFTNLLAIGLTLGLASPWAKVRHIEYMLSHFRVFTVGELDDFQADKRDYENALGDAATDFLNVDFSL